MKIDLAVLAICFGAMLVSADENDTTPKDIAPLNATLQAAIAKGESWTGDPSLIAAKLTGPWISNSPNAEPASQKREIVAATAGEGETSKATVTVKNIGLFDDAVWREDHSFNFELVGEKWTVVSASTKHFSDRNPFPLNETENLPKRRAGVMVVYASTGNELQELAEKEGIEELSVTVSNALEGDPDSLVKVLKLSTKVDGAAAEIYAELVYGLNCAFESRSFLRFMFFNLEEPEVKAIREFLEWIETDLVPN